MSDLLWPGDDRAGDHVSDEALLEQMLEVEAAWTDVLCRAGVAPPEARVVLDGLVRPGDLEWLVDETEDVGNPAGALVALLRDALQDGEAEAARWLHRGLTSQDVLDSALVLEAQRACAAIVADLRAQAAGLVTLVATHRDTPMVARTLTQHAVPTTFGLVAAGWLEGVLDALEQVEALVFPVQLGGAAGTLAALVELGLDPLAARAGLAERLGLADAPAWHTRRTPVTRIGDALVGCTDAWGHLANDVLTLGRPEVAEVRGADAGGSSTMPGKANPVLAVLVRRAALAAPPLGATLHQGAGQQVDQRADGAWHVEWATLRTLLRRTVVAASQVADLLTDLEVDPSQMVARLDAARAQVTAEQRVMAGLADHAPTGDYLGAAGLLVDATLARARSLLEQT